MGFDEKIVSGLDTILENGINSVGREMCDCIEAQKGNANNMETARRLSLLIESLGNGYRLAKDEQQYESKNWKNLLLPWIKSLMEKQLAFA